MKENKCREIGKQMRGTWIEFLFICIFTFSLSFLKNEFTQGYNQNIFFQTNKRNQNCKLIRKTIKGSENKFLLSLRRVSVFTLCMIWNKNLYTLGIFFQIPLSGCALIQTTLLLGGGDQEPRAVTGSCGSKVPSSIW